jgi:hypothetical protein
LYPAFFRPSSKSDPSSPQAPRLNLGPTDLYELEAVGFRHERTPKWFPRTFSRIQLINFSQGIILQLFWPGALLPMSSYAVIDHLVAPACLFLSQEAQRQEPGDVSMSILAE